MKDEFTEMIIPGFPKMLWNLFPKHAFLFGGGGTTAAPVTPPITAVPVPPAAPPVTSTNAEVVQTQQDARRQALKKRGFSKAIYAGETGGWNGSGAAQGLAGTKIPGNESGPGPKTLGQ